VNDYAKPLPDPRDQATAAFWAGTRESLLLIQKCAACGYLRWPPAPACPECLSTRAEWTRVSPTGTLLTYCVYHRAFSKAFAGDIPYAVGYVQLDDGPRLYGTMAGAPSTLGALAVGLPVHAVFDPVTPEVTLVRWAVTAPAGGAREQETKEGTVSTS
jgi:hypothetical protein